MTGKEYMQHIRHVRRDINFLIDQIERERVLAENVKAIRYDIDHVQTSPIGDRMTDVVADIIEVSEKLKDRIDEYLALEDEARNYLTLLKVEHERVLVLHYFDGMKYDNIADKLMYSERYVYELRDRALEELTEVLNKSEQI